MSEVIIAPAVVCPTLDQCRVFLLKYFLNKPTATAVHKSVVENIYVLTVPLCCKKILGRSCKNCQWLLINDILFVMLFFFCFFKVVEHFSVEVNHVVFHLLWQTSYQKSTKICIGYGSLYSVKHHVKETQWTHFPKKFITLIGSLQLNLGCIL